MENKFTVGDKVVYLNDDYDGRQNTTGVIDEIIEDSDDNHGGYNVEFDKDGTTLFAFEHEVELIEDEAEPEFDPEDFYVTPYVQPDEPAEFNQSETLTLTFHGSYGMNRYQSANISRTEETLCLCDIAQMFKSFLLSAGYSVQSVDIDTGETIFSSDQ